MPPEFYRWLLNTALAHFMNDHELAFPIVQSLHFVGFALSIGTIAIVDFRMLGLGIQLETPAELTADLRPWTEGGIALMLTTGPMMFAADAVNLHLNPSFQFKMVCLTVALLYHFTVHQWGVRPGVSPIAAKLVATASLLLWTIVLAAGRMIAFI